MFFRRRKNKIFALRSRSEVPESAALRPSPGGGIFVLAATRCRTYRPWSALP
ncbi:Uncharacterized protein dnm_097590 [Desulfonema magnum]|uniref:Uncharacterized protein n=1 Tax=Desulfonema magnum TaxID=45655 RepID=A0A975BZI1_9BACT|nr:Uncharacterized protein dnm_097590 [Desulfonema magnum]